MAQTLYIIILGILGFFLPSLLAHPGVVFGAVDNLGVILGCALGVDLEAMLATRMDRGASPVIGAAIGGGAVNAGTDFGGALADPAMFGMALGILVGCLLPLVLIPALARLQTWREARREARADGETTDDCDTEDGGPCPDCGHPVYYDTNHENWFHVGNHECFMAGPEPTDDDPTPEPSDDDIDAAIDDYRMNSTMGGREIAAERERGETTLRADDVHVGQFVTVPRVNILTGETDALHGMAFVVIALPGRGQMIGDIHLRFVDRTEARRRLDASEGGAFWTDENFNDIFREDIEDAHYETFEVLAWDATFADAYRVAILNAPTPETDPTTTFVRVVPGETGEAFARVMTLADALDMNSDFPRTCRALLDMAGPGASVLAYGDLYHHVEVWTSSQIQAMREDDGIGALAEFISECPALWYRMTDEERAWLDFCGERFAVSSVLLGSSESECGKIFRMDPISLGDALISDGVDRAQCLSEDTELASILWICSAFPEVTPDDAPTPETDPSDDDRTTVTLTREQIGAVLGHLDNAIECAEACGTDGDDHMAEDLRLTTEAARILSGAPETDPDPTDDDPNGMSCEEDWMHSNHADDPTPDDPAASMMSAIRSALEDRQESFGHISWTPAREHGKTTIMRRNGVNITCSVPLYGSAVLSLPITIPARHRKWLTRSEIGSSCDQAILSQIAHNALEFEFTDHDQDKVSGSIPAEYGGADTAEEHFIVYALPNGRDEIMRVVFEGLSQDNDLELTATIRVGLGVHVDSADDDPNDNDE